MSDDIEMTEISPPEKFREYEFPGGDKVRLEEVTHLLVRPSGTHRLRTKDGTHHIIPTGWLHVAIGIDNWTC